MLNILVPIDNYFLRVLFHLAMLPIVAGVSYEVLMGLAHSNSGIARILRWPGLQMQRLTTREPDASMLECAIVSVNVVLYGLPKHAKKTPEGWAILHDWRESRKDYVPPVTEEAISAEAAVNTEGKAEATEPVKTVDQEKKAEAKDAVWNEAAETAAKAAGKAEEADETADAGNSVG